MPKPKGERSTITRSGARRLGDDYQDIVALEMLIDWLEHSDRYEWVQVEADGAGVLDDVDARKTNGISVYRQVKFAVHPNDPKDALTWERLLEQEAGAKGKKQSLLQAWYASLQKIMEPDQFIDAALYTNRDAPEVSQAFLQNGNSQVDFTKIAPTIREKIIEQLGGDEQARVFFQQFRFGLSRPNLPELEDGLKQRFTVLGGTHEGWLSLKSELRKWVCYRNMPPPDGHIHLADIQKAAIWHTAEGLAQNYTIPDDYAPPQNFLEDFEQKVLPSHSGNIVVTGSPGIGKSTFISYLYTYFQDMNIPAVRHHYYLGTQDPAPGLRLDYLHAAQSLIHNLARDHNQALGDLRGENPRPENLRKWLTACGEYYNKQDKTFYVLLDGFTRTFRDGKYGIIEAYISFLHP